MREAIRLADYFVAHAERVWRRLVESPEDAAMRRVYAWMEKKGRAVSAREIQQAGVAALKRALDVKGVLDRMLECDMLEQHFLGQTARFTIKRHGQRTHDV
jgi:hypothetical protein